MKDVAGIPDQKGCTSLCQTPNSERGEHFLVRGDKRREVGVIPDQAGCPDTKAIWTGPSFQNRILYGLGHRSGFMQAGWESFGCRSFLQNSFVRRLSTFSFLSNVSISLGFLCLSSASCHQLLRTHWALPMCGTCSLGLPSRVLQNTPLTGNSARNQKKTFMNSISLRALWGLNPGPFKSKPWLVSSAAGF